MPLAHWILFYLISLVLWLWILNWGGAKWLEGWRAWLILDWFAGHWNAEQIRLYALTLLGIETIWFLLGIGFPELRVRIVH